MNKEIRKDFPILNRKINGKDLVYFDNAATSQVPKQVLDEIYDFEVNHRSNVHRGIHTLSEEATELFENARKNIANFIDATVPEEIVFVKNSTEAINLVAYSWARNNLNKGDIILVSEGEHHSNLIPWQRVAKEKDLKLDFIPIDQDGFIDIKSTNTDWAKVKLVAFTHVSNVFGVVNDVQNIIKYIKNKIIYENSVKGKVSKDDFPKILLDLSQSVPHMKVNIKKLGADFAAFSGHKMCGPMGIGVLWIKRDLFEELDVFNTGGGMIRSVELEDSTFAPMPELLEAGTPNVSGAIGLSAAVDYLNNIGMDNVEMYEKALTKYAMDKLLLDEDIQIYGTKNIDKKIGVITFTIKGISSHDLATVLDSQGVAIRSGHHCVMPWHVKNDLSASARASFYLYNTKEEIDAFLKAIEYAKELLTR